MAVSSDDASRPFAADPGFRSRVAHRIEVRAQGDSEPLRIAAHLL
jgi:hypothetical protein